MKLSVIALDYDPLAGEVRTLEDRHRSEASVDTVPEIVAAIRARYDVVEDEIAAPSEL